MRAVESIEDVLTTNNGGDANDDAPMDDGWSVLQPRGQDFLGWFHIWFYGSQTFFFQHFIEHDTPLYKSFNVHK